MKDGVSLILYCYRNELVLDQSLATILSQEDVSYEIIAIDDGNDIPLEKKFAKHDIKCVRFSKPVGQLNAFAVGYAMSAYRYGVFQLATDYNTPNRLATQLEYLKTTGYDAAVCKKNFIDPDNPRDFDVSSVMYRRGNDFEVQKLFLPSLYASVVDKRLEEVTTRGLLGQMSVQLVTIDNRSEVVRFENARV